MLCLADHLDFRRFFRFARAAAITSSTFAGSTCTSLRIKFLNAVNPLMNFSAMSKILCQSHESSIVYAADLHRPADAMEHKPCCRLPHSERSRKFMTADAGFEICDCPDRDKPLNQTEFRVFKNRTDLVRKLLSTLCIFALHHVATGNLADLFSATLRADRLSARPAKFLHILIADGRIGKVADNVKESVRCVHVSGSIFYILHGVRDRRRRSCRRSRSRRRQASP